MFFELETKAPLEATTLVAERHEIRNGKIVYVDSAFDGRPFERMFGQGTHSKQYNSEVRAGDAGICLVQLARIFGVEESRVWENCRAVTP